MSGAILNSKTSMTAIAESLLQVLQQQGREAFLHSLNRQVLSQKVRFPILEHAATIFHRAIPARQHFPLCETIAATRLVGAWALVGKWWQLLQSDHWEESLRRAEKWMTAGDEWYVCDIVGERVLGHGLLTQPLRMLPHLQALSRHQNHWMVRGVGVAAHYAVKKGLPRAHCAPLFTLLLSLGGDTRFHVKRGIGWGAKTVARYHPDLVQALAPDWETHPQLKTWFRTKVRIGLGRAAYDKGD